MDFAVLLAPVATGVTDTVEAVLPIAVPILVLLASVTIALAIFRKFGVKR